MNVITDYIKATVQASTTSQQSSPPTRWAEIWYCKHWEICGWNDTPTGAVATATVSWTRGTRHTVLQRRSDREVTKDLDSTYNKFNSTIVNTRGRRTYTAGTVNSVPLLKGAEKHVFSVPLFMTRSPQSAPNWTDLHPYFQKISRG